MSEIVKLNQVPPAKNFFQEYGEEVASQAGGNIIGKLLKFNKGDWLLGMENEEVPVGTRYVASMEALYVGWVRWFDSKPTQEVSGRPLDRYRPVPRSTLGDHDQEMWELDQNGKPRDPWVATSRMLLKPVGKKYTEATAATFITNSTGGRTAVGKFMVAYGDGMAGHEGMNPIMELGVDSYMHSNKAYGRIKFPVLSLVGWEKGSLFAVPDDTEEAEEEVVAAAAPKRVGRSRK